MENPITISNNISKVAIVTGGSKGIGAAIVKTLAENGYNVVLNYNSSYQLAKNLAENFNNVKIFKADVSNYLEVEKLINFTISTFGRIDILVNNAGIDLIKPITDTSLEDFDHVLKS